MTGSTTAPADIVAADLRKLFDAFQITQILPRPDIVDGNGRPVSVIEDSSIAVVPWRVIARGMPSQRYEGLPTEGYAVQLDGTSYVNMTDETVLSVDFDNRALLASIGIVEHSRQEQAPNPSARNPLEPYEDGYQAHGQS